MRVSLTRTVIRSCIPTYIIYTLILEHTYICTYAYLYVRICYVGYHKFLVSCNMLITIIRVVYYVCTYIHTYVCRLIELHCVLIIATCRDNT